MIALVFDLGEIKVEFPFDEGTSSSTILKAPDLNAYLKADILNKEAKD
ncbi:MAG: hypothetical protein AAF789_13580 [Bacteroidota bacterium]